MRINGQDYTVNSRWVHQGGASTSCVCIKWARQHASCVCASTRRGANHVCASTRRLRIKRVHHVGASCVCVKGAVSLQVVAALTAVSACSGMALPAWSMKPLQPPSLPFDSWVRAGWCGPFYHALHYRATAFSMGGFGTPRSAQRMLWTWGKHARTIKTPAAEGHPSGNRKQCASTV